MIDVNEIEKLRNNGLTYQEIADKFGVSKQYVNQILPRVRKFDIEKIPYKGIYEFLQKNKTMSISCFIRGCFGHNGGAENMRFTRLICGIDCNISIRHLKKIMEFTGMTFEELFELRDNL